MKPRCRRVRDILSPFPIPIPYPYSYPYPYPYLTPLCELVIVLYGLCCVVLCVYRTYIHTYIHETNHVTLRNATLRKLPYIIERGIWWDADVDAE